MTPVSACTDTAEALVGGSELNQYIVCHEMARGRVSRQVLHVFAFGRAEVVNGKRLVFAVDEVCDLLDRAERKDRQDASEDLLGHQLGVLVGLQDDGGLDVAFLDVDDTTADNFAAACFDASL